MGLQCKYASFKNDEAVDSAQDVLAEIDIGVGFMKVAIWALLIAAVMVLIYSLAAVASKCSREEERDVLQPQDRGQEAAEKPL